MFLQQALVALCQLLEVTEGDTRWARSCIRVSRAQGLHDACLREDEWAKRCCQHRLVSRENVREGSRWIWQLLLDDVKRLWGESGHPSIHAHAQC